MLIWDSKEYRNLVEQVQKNKEDIAAHYNIDRVLADFGIKVVGQRMSADNLPDPATYQGNYGDAFAVGTQPPYSIYVWTRADVDSGHPTDYWFDIGQIAIVGPQGPAGKDGAQGPKGRDSLWYTADSLDNAPSADNDDMLLITAGVDKGNVYKYVNSIWTLQSNIIGPQGVQGKQGIPGEIGPVGPQGEKGETGDVGGFINIYGILASVDELPTPETLDNPTVAYLIGSAEPYTLYIQVGETVETRTWNNVGSFNTATYVTVGGVGQNVWDADTKLDKPSAPSAVGALVFKPNGTSEIRTLTNTPTNGWIAIYGGVDQGDSVTSNGRLITGTPTKNFHCATKKYVDDSITTLKDEIDAELLSTAADSNKAYVPVYNNKVRQMKLTYAGNTTLNEGTTDGCIAQYKSTLSYGDNEPQASLLTKTPTKYYQCANKKYVDDKIKNLYCREVVCYFAEEEGLSNYQVTQQYTAKLTFLVYTYYNDITSIQGSGVDRAIETYQNAFAIQYEVNGKTKNAPLIELLEFTSGERPVFEVRPKFEKRYYYDEETGVETEYPAFVIFTEDSPEFTVYGRSIYIQSTGHIIK